MVDASTIPYPTRRAILEFAAKETARLVWEANCPVSLEVQNIIKNALILGCVHALNLNKNELDTDNKSIT